MLTSLTIMAHGAAQETFNRHVPLWRRLVSDDKILVIAPATDPIKDCPFSFLNIGQHGHATKASVDRLKLALGNIIKFGSGYHLICEYDSFALTPDFKMREGLSGPLMPNKEPCRFMAPRYPNPPWLVDWRTACLMWQCANRWPSVIEEGFADRYLAALAYLANVPILDCEPSGFTRATITQAFWFLTRKAIERGGVMIHGVKDAETLDVVLKAYAAKTKQQSNGQ